MIWPWQFRELKWAGWARVGLLLLVSPWIVFDFVVGFWYLGVLQAALTIWIAYGYKRLIKAERSLRETRRQIDDAMRRFSGPWN